MNFVAVLVLAIFTSVIVLLNIRQLKNKRKKVLIKLLVFNFMLLFFSSMFIELYNMYIILEQNEVLYYKD